MSDLPIEEYFRYHPPTTEERKQKHDVINNAALQFAKDPGLYSWFTNLIRENVEDEKTQQMAIASTNLALLLVNHDEESSVPIEQIILSWWEQVRSIPKEELFLYLVQQARMFSNQGITVDELKLINSIDDK
jgi:hypothetical protein